MAANINFAGKKLLQPNIEGIDSTGEITVETTTDAEAQEGEGEPVNNSAAMQMLKKRKKSRKAQAQDASNDADSVRNEELRALEAYMLRATKQCKILLPK